MTTRVALLQRVNHMQAAHTEPEAFKASFDDFVARADDHLDVFRPFFPMLVCFLGNSKPSSVRVLAAEAFGTTKRQRIVAEVLLCTMFYRIGPHRRQVQTSGSYRDCPGRRGRVEPGFFDRGSFDRIV